MNGPDPSASVILLVDDHELLATSLAYMLRVNGFNAYRVPVTDSSGILLVAARYAPGVVLLDLGLGVGGNGRPLDGTDLVAPLRELGWVVLVMTGTNDRDRIAAAIARGACNWIVKTAAFDELVRAAADVARGCGALPEHERDVMILRHRENDARRQVVLARIRRLTARENSVLCRLSEGSSASAIAAETYTSLGTVRTHIRSILAKLEVNSQLAAVAVAHRCSDQLSEDRNTRVIRDARRVT